MKQDRARIIILKKHKYKEADLIVHGLTNKGGKISLLARGALRSKKRFGGGVLEPTHFVDIQYRGSQVSHGLNTLQEAQLIQDFANLRLDYDRLVLALSILDSVAKLAQEGDETSKELFDLTGHGLKALSELAQSDLQKFRLQFYLKLLFQQGVLEVESWMRPYLDASIANAVALMPGDQLGVQSERVQALISRYLALAGD